MSKAYFPTIASGQDYAAKPPTMARRGWKATTHQHEYQGDEVTHQERPELYTVRVKGLDVEAVIKVILLNRCVFVDALGDAGLGSFVAVYEYFCRHCDLVQR